MVRLIGDIHGDWYNYLNIALASPDKKSIQVGDFGIGFAGSYWHELTNEFHAQEDHRFIRGNHDNPDKCRKEMIGYIPDGSVENETMFIGGAWSIDHAWRTEGINWWCDEQCSYAEMDLFLNVYEATKPRYMITHDAPIEITNEMFIKTGLSIGGREAKQIPNVTNQALQAMFEIHQPEFWFFGHWHITKHLKYGNTTFMCLGEMDYVDFDFEKGDFICI